MECQLELFRLGVSWSSLTWHIIQTNWDGIQIELACGCDSMWLADPLSMTAYLWEDGWLNG